MKSLFKPSARHAALKTAMIAAIALGGAAFGANSYAKQETSTFGVTATVEASCTISGTTLAFGIISALGADVDATSALTATCTYGSAYTVGLDAGTGLGATVTARKMTSGTDLLNYSLYTDTGRTTNWDDIGGTSVVAGTGTGAGQAITVYGRVPTGQTSTPVGSYSDTITVTIDF
jgi:spore coat protein U-like protein